MDYQNRVGNKKGGGGLASSADTNAHRRDRLKQLAMETINLEKDPYIFKNHLGFFECKLCLTSHVTDGSYLSHTQGRKHQMNLARREALDRETRRGEAGLSGSGANTIAIKKNLVKIGRPGYKITKIRDPLSKQVGLLFQMEYPEIGLDVVPRYRFMSAFEQKVDLPHDRRFQYLLVAAEPYETCAFKIDAREIDQRPGKFWTYWDPDTKEYFLQLLYKPEK